MKQDKLEQFIRDHREEFDYEQPSPEIWNAIEQKLPKETKVRPINWKGMLRIAAVFLLGAFSWAVVNYFIQQSTSTSRQAMSSENTVQIKRIKPIYRDLKKNQRVISEDKNLGSNNHLTENIKSKNSNADSYQNELNEMQAFYTSQINEKRIKLQQFSSKRPEIGKEIDVEFMQIDSIYSSTLKDLKDNINNQEVIEAMIMNYRARIQVLDMMLQQLSSKYASL
jgi:hypothetical protein